MAQLIWSPQARRQFFVLADYMLEVAPEQADAVLDRLVEAADRLIDFPHLGRRLELEGEQHARELIAGRFHLIYTTDGKTVEVSALLHSSLDVQARLHELFGEP